MANKSNYPLALYCTAGKDRTGIVIALALLCLGIPEQAILDDYTLSDDAYAQLEDKAAMVGALEQHDLDADTFLRAPRSVMESTLQLLQVRIFVHYCIACEHYIYTRCVVGQLAVIAT
jgi:protein-tyrosine phosphatase